MTGDQAGGFSGSLITVILRRIQCRAFACFVKVAWKVRQSLESAPIISGKVALMENSLRCGSGCLRWSAGGHLNDVIVRGNLDEGGA
jgi:hypothetical protein